MAIRKRRCCKRSLQTSTERSVPRETEKDRTTIIGHVLKQSSFKATRRDDEQRRHHITMTRHRWMTFLLLKLSILWFLLDLCWATATSSPLNVGVRSALARFDKRLIRSSSFWCSSKGRGGTNAWSQSRCHRNVHLASLAYDDDDDEDPQEITPAFFRETQEEVQRMRTVEFAYLTKNHGEETEEDFITSVYPCSSHAVAIASSEEKSETNQRGGASLALNRPLLFWENMLAGAISRSLAQTIMHPANTMKTILQKSGSPKMMELLQPSNFRRLTNGAGANFLLSVPHGAVNFAVLEFVRKKLAAYVDSNPTLAANAERMGPGLDFLSSAVSTIITSVVSTPQMMITDNIMAGNYNSLPAAIQGLAKDRGVAGFYSGWWPGLVGKIPSYALTWTFFQQLKVARDRLTGRPATDVENSIMGCIASGTTVCLMIPLDTIKTRLVTQSGGQMYNGIIDCAVRVAREEGIGAFYRGLPPRLVSVVPMIGIQFGIYEFMKRAMNQRKYTMLAKETAAKQTAKQKDELYAGEDAFQEAIMEVAASPEHPYPAPHFQKRVTKPAKQGWFMDLNFSGWFGSRSAATTTRKPAKRAG